MRLPAAHCLTPQVLPLQADQLVQHLVGRRDDLRRSGISPLRHDQARELLSQVDSRGFERTRLDVARAANACAAHRESARARSEAIDATMLGQQAIDVAKGREWNLIDAAGEA